jgi:hypothetical protein
MTKLIPIPLPELERTAKRFEREITRLLKALKKDIGDDYRASDDPDDKLPGMLVTVSTDNELSGWNYQTGDNSYTGGCYGQSHWAVIYLYRKSNCADLAHDAVEELLDLVAKSHSLAGFRGWEMRTERRRAKTLLTVALKACRKVGL